MAPVRTLALVGFAFLFTTFMSPVISSVVLILLSNIEVAAVTLSTVLLVLAMAGTANAAPTSPSAAPGSIHPTSGEIVGIVVGAILGTLVLLVVLLEMRVCDFHIYEKIKQCISPRRWPILAAANEEGEESGIQGHDYRQSTYGTAEDTDVEQPHGVTLTPNAAEDSIATTQAADDNQQTQEHDKVNVGDDEQPISDAQRALDRAEALAMLTFFEREKEEE